MRKRLLSFLLALGCAGLVAGTAAAAYQAPDTALTTSGQPAACTLPPNAGGVVLHYAFYHCYTPQDIRDAYGVSQLGDPSTSTGTGLLGAGQTIVLVDSYGSPTAASDLQFFHDTFFPNLKNPDFTQVFPYGTPNFSNANPNAYGNSGPAGAAGWSGEATLDIEWAYAIAPLAHIVLIAVPPAETEGVQGFPNLFKAISQQIDANPSGTVFSMSFGVTEQTFGGAAQQQVAKFDAVFQKGIAKGDTFFASAGDSGTLGVAKQHRESATYPYPTAGWPASSPYVTAVGGTQLQYGWTWNPGSDVWLTATGSLNPAYFAWNDDPASNLNVVWNESWLSAATGGAPSAIYARQPWQNSVQNVVGNARGVPDLSWDAAVNGGVLVYITAFPTYQRAGWHVYGGTSAASPQVAALTALAVEQAGHGLGNIDTAIYNHPEWFTDIAPASEGTALSGQLVNNQVWDWPGPGAQVVPDPVPGEPVNTGYDMTNGLGVPKAYDYVLGLAGS